MDAEEVFSIMVASLAIGFVFASTYLYRLNVYSFVGVFLIASFSVIAHEMAHRQVARIMNCYSRYALYPLGLLVTLLSSLPVIPIKIILPGVTVIIPRTYDHSELKRIEGITSVAGPLVNISFSIAGFISMGVLGPLEGMSHYIRYFIYINSWIALFNLLPIPPLDGSKVLRWNLPLYLISFVAALALFIRTVGY
ncbi:MAG: site-2 protease family protein [Thermosphaera sp.]